MADHGRDDRGSLDHVGDWPVKSPTILRARLISFSMRALGPYLLSRCCASALLSPCSGLTASWARTLSTGSFSRSIAVCDPPSGARVADCRATADMDSSLERACGNLRKEFPKITRCGLWVDIKDRPIAPDIELKFPPRARCGNGDHEFGLSFGSFMARLRASDIGNWMLMARGGIGFSNHC